MGFAVVSSPSNTSFSSNMRLIHLTLLVSFVCASPLGPKESPHVLDVRVDYNGHRVYRVTPSSDQEARDIEHQFSTYHTHPIRNSLSIVIPPHEVESFERLGLDARLVNADLGGYIRSIDEESSYDRRLHKRGELPNLSWFDSYHSYADHLQYWDDLVSAFPKNSEKFSIGQSYQNRTIYAFHLFGNEDANDQGKGKPVILWHATVHAREWISTMGRLLTL